VGQTNWSQFQGSRITKENRDQPTNQPTKELTDGGELRKSASRRALVYLTSAVLTALLGSITDNLNCNWDCVYAKEFPLAVEDPDIDKLRAIAQAAIDIMGGRKLFASLVRCVFTCRVGCTLEPKLHMQSLCIFCIVYLAANQQKRICFAKNE
jgi:hypothetical protein